MSLAFSKIEEDKNTCDRGQPKKVLSTGNGKQTMMMREIGEVIGGVAAGILGKESEKELSSPNHEKES